MESMQTTLEHQTLSFFLPEKTLEFFDIVSSDKTDSCITIILEEKNIPPVEDRHKGMSVFSKGFTDFTVNDFSARGRKVLLTLRRRRWQVGDELLKREIPIAAPGTQLEKEFADFLKERS